MDWNDRGEITVRGQTVPGTHLVDLLKYTVSSLSKQKPKGYVEFYHALQEMHIPTGFIAHHKDQTGYGSVKGKPSNGPPGDKYKPEKKTKQFKWLPY